MNRREAYSELEAAEAEGRLRELAAHWNLSGWRDESAPIDVADLYELIDQSCTVNDSRAPSGDDETELEALP